MPISMTILGHRGEGCTNKNPDVYGKNLSPRHENYYNNEILPENSLSAIENALNHGAGGVEVDVFSAKDDVVVIHDAELARNVDGYHYWGKEQNDELFGYVSDYTCEELKKKFTIGNNESIPTLDEVIQLILKYNDHYKEKHHRNYLINIELKSGLAISRAVHTIVKKYIENPDCALTENDFLFNSFDKTCIQEMLRLNPKSNCALGIPTKDLFGEVKIPGWIPISHTYQPNAFLFLGNLISSLNLSSLDLVSSDITEEMVEFCVKNNLGLNATIIPLRLQAAQNNQPSLFESGLELEKKELKRLASFSEKYNLHLNYRTDNPGLMKAYLEKLMALKLVAQEENKKASLFLSQSNFNPTLFSTLKANLKKYHSITNSDLGRELTSAYIDAIDEQSRVKLK